MPGMPDDRPETVLAFDYGLRRIGVAVGQAVTRSASALCTLANRADGPDWQQVDRLVQEWHPTRLLVGMPQTADGTEAALKEPIDAFCKRLRAYALPIELVDERHTSREAGEQLLAERKAGRRGRIAKGDIDAAAAAVIAERWLQGWR